jgi:small conductance mechanosensitive channel
MPMPEQPGQLQVTFHKLGLDAMLVLKIGAILLAAWVVERIIYLVLRRGYKRAKAQGRDEQTRYRFLLNAVRFLVGIAGAIAIIQSVPALHSFAVTLFAGAGIMVAIIGLAAQKAFSNIISGIFIVLFKPFRVGDSIKVGTTLSGTVEDVTLRHTVILSGQNNRIIIPNSVISDDYITNNSIRDEAMLEHVEVPVAYDTDLDLAIRILQEECGKHKDLLDKRTEEEKRTNTVRVPVRLVRLEDSGLVLRAYIWAKDEGTAKLMHYELNKRIVERFRAESIEMPFPTRKIIHVQADPDREVPATSAS